MVKLPSPSAPHRKHWPGSVSQLVNFQSISIPESEIGGCRVVRPFVAKCSATGLQLSTTLDVRDKVEIAMHHGQGDAQEEVVMSDDSGTE